jgi:hypothetical protein
MGASAAAVQLTLAPRAGSTMRAMGVRRGVLAATIAAACALLCVLPVRALASATQQSILMDDDELIYSSSGHVADRLAQLKALGVDRVKVSVVWSLVAPDASSTQPPHFDATDPGAYPSGAWDRYDRIVTMAAQLGLGVYFQFTPPAPAWALQPGLPRGQGIPLGQAPNASDFGRFVQAVGRRYNGSYSSPPDTSDPSSGISLPLSLPGLGGRHVDPPPSSLPAVSFWSVWNEPNFPSWLNPWYRTLRGGQRQMLQPMIYRGLVNAAWRSLAATGHSHDTFLIGETANFGNLYPVPFIQDLYCLDSRSRPVSGRAATAIGCPTRPSRSGFRSANPGLFAITGFAHHPYGFNVEPSRPYPRRGWITLYNLNSLESVLRGVSRAYGSALGNGIALYLTEWGYKSRPPNPFVKTSTSQQAVWLNEGDFMTFQNRFVRALTQFELVDSPPKAGAPAGTPQYWSTFQTGLLYHDGAPKPSYTAYRLPIWIPHPRHGSRVAVWGQLRPANHTGLQYGEIEYRRAGQHAWSTVREVQTSSPEGFLVAHVPLPAAGTVRLAWLDPSGTTYYSRPVSIS